jgi:hypothetical protein
MYGYFSVDLLVDSNNPEDQRIYFIGLDCHLNAMASSLYCLNFLTNSQFDIDSNQIKVNRRNTEDMLNNQAKLNQSSDSANTMLSAPSPAASNTNAVYVYFPFMLYDGFKECQIKSFFQSCRFGNVSFDVVQRQGVVFMLLDVLQSMSIGLIATASSYSQALKYGQTALDFLTKQYPWLDGLRQDEHCDRIELTTIKSKLAILLKRQ